MLRPCLDSLSLLINDFYRISGRSSGIQKGGEKKYRFNMGISGNSPFTKPVLLSLTKKNVAKSWGDQGSRLSRIAYFETSKRSSKNKKHFFQVYR